ncbi:ankyrin repeat domain-containing protein [Granulosicoccus sp.]|nr:ankyrin repeat domain-containing protein [Granulosicoccus sp.]MDB4224347.1 ankyrin repeat domain-containing protein [Granulosicoccus sp.]
MKQLLIIVLAMLVTSAGALHSWYSKDLYVKAALLSEAYPIASAVKTQVSDHFIEFGVLPNSNIEANLPSADSFFGTSVGRVNVRQGGLIQVGFDGNGLLGDGAMTFSPAVSPVTGYLYWRCSSDSIDKHVLRKIRPACNYEPASLESDLIKTIENRNLPAFIKVMELGVVLDGFSNGVTPLMSAASIGDLEVLNRLIEQGADVNLQAKNHDGLTAIMIAIRNRHSHIVSRLLASGASTTIKDKHGRSALNHATQISRQFGDVRMYSMVGQVQNPQFMAHPAESYLPTFAKRSSQSSRETLKRKIKMLGDLCPYAAVANLRSRIKSSCDSAVSNLPELSDEKPELALTTLNLAIEELAEPILLEHIDEFVISPEQINAQGLMGQTSLMKAISVNKPEFASKLIDLGADVNGLSINRSRPLIEASKLGNTQLVRQLMNEGADLNAADSMGRTALLAAVGRGHEGVVGTLIQAGAETRTTDANGIDAFLLAKNRRFFVIERMLLAAKGT